MSNVVYVLVDGVWKMKMGGPLLDRPSGRRVSGSAVPDVTDPGTIVEIKGPGDRLSKFQKDNYEQLVAQQGKKLEVLDTDRCDCDGYRKDAEEAAAEQKQEQTMTAARNAATGAGLRYLAGKLFEGPVGDLIMLKDLMVQAFTIRGAQ